MCQLFGWCWDADPRKLALNGPDAIIINTMLFPWVFTVSLSEAYFCRVVEGLPPYLGEIVGILVKDAFGKNQ
jgi:cytosine/uracil/thiamine/allantoin permease